MKNAAVGVIDAPPDKTTVNNQAPNYAAPLIVLVVFALSLIPFTWWGLVFLADTAGFDNPRRAVAYAIIGLACGIVPFVAIVLAVAKLVSNYFEHRERLAETYGEWQYKIAIASRQPVGNSRTMGEDLRFVRLVEAVMTEAYLHVERSGQYTKNDAKPWARGQAKEIVLANEREPVGWKMGSRVRSWLQERGVLKGDAIDLARFPDIGSVQELLRMEYEVPVAIGQSPALPSGGDSWSIIPGTH